MEETFDTTLTVYDENNYEVKVEVLDIFTLEAYPNNEYILYTKNETEGEYIKTYVSIIKKAENQYIFESIDDQQEFDAVQDYINSSVEEGE